MKDIGFMKNKCMILMALLVVMTSCVKTKQYYLGDEARSWFVDDDKREFTIRDENGFERRMHVVEPSAQIMDESTSVMFVTTDKAERESVFQYGYLDYASGCYVGITAGWGKEVNVDDRFEIGLYGLTFSFSLNGKTFTPIMSESPRINFTAELLDSFEVDGVAYPEVLHIQLIEYENLTDKDPTELYYAKHYGLVQYSIQYGIKYFRIAK